MARVKSFWIHPTKGVPDQDIRAFISIAENQMGIVTVNSVFIPATYIEENGVQKRTADPRLTVIVTKLDDVDPIEEMQIKVNPSLLEHRG